MREKALIYVKADIRGGARAQAQSLTEPLLTLHCESNSNQHILCELASAANTMQSAIYTFYDAGTSACFFHFFFCSLQF